MGIDLQNFIMTEATSKRLRNALVAIAAVILATGLFLGNYTRTHSTNLAALAEQALPLEVALNNDKPTLVEFYADWCTTCQLMAPMMANLKQDLGGEINFVMLNVDNPKWLPELDQYQVNGIPHFVFMDAQGETKGTAVGEQPQSIMRANLIALGQGAAVEISGSGQTSGFAAPVEEKGVPDQPDPRSHG